MSHLTILIFILLLIVLSFTSALSELCNPRDKQALLQIKSLAILPLFLPGSH
ncbi:hypothetical protein GLYMA_05G123750v4 [Glycine max]|nr:hypothetical protein GLYMA_05G123750v4 [Glycine max]